MSHWRFVVTMLSIAVVALIAIYWNSVTAAVTVWSASDTYGFAFIVAPVSLYLIWDRRHRLAEHRVRPFLPGLFLAVPCGLFWLLSDAADLSVGRQLAVMGTLQTLLLTTLGWRIYRTLLFPLLYLWFLVPAADILLPDLQLMVTRATVAGLDLLGIPSTSDGILIVADGATYRIVEQCASLDFLLGSLAYALVYANVLYRRTHRRVAFVAAALAAAVAANLFRTTSIIAITDFSEGRIDLAGDHQLYGWLIFLVTVIVVMGIGLRFREDGKEDISLVEHPWDQGLDRRQTFVAAGAAALLLASLAPAYAAYSAPTDPIPANLAMCTPSAQAPWHATTDEGDWRAKFPTSDLTLSRHYVSAEHGVDLFIAYYWRQRPEVELIAWGNQLTDERTWHLLGQTPRQVEVEGRQLIVTESSLFAKNHPRRMIWHWNWIDGRFTAGRLTAKLLQTKTRLMTGDRRAAFIGVSVVETDGPAAARAILRSLIADALSLTPCLEAVGPVPK